MRRKGGGPNHLHAKQSLNIKYRFFKLIFNFNSNFFLICFSLRLVSLSSRNMSKELCETSDWVVQEALSSTLAVQQVSTNLFIQYT